MIKLREFDERFFVGMGVARNEKPLFGGCVASRHTLQVAIIKLMLRLKLYCKLENKEVVLL
jgi:hypothetical protein